MQAAQNLIMPEQNYLTLAANKRGAGISSSIKFKNFRDVSNGVQVMWKVGQKNNKYLNTK